MLLSWLGSQPEMTPAAETMTALEHGIAPVVRGGLAALLSTVFFFVWSKTGTFSSQQEKCGVQIRHKLQCLMREQ